MLLDIKKRFSRLWPAYCVWTRTGKPWALMEGSNSPHTLPVTMGHVPLRSEINNLSVCCFLVMCMKLPPTLDEQGAPKCRYWLGGRPGGGLYFSFLLVFKVGLGRIHYRIVKPVTSHKGLVCLHAQGEDML